MNYFIFILNLYSKRFFLRCNEISDGKVVSLSKKQYGFAAYFKKHHISLKSTFDETYNVVCGSSLLFEIFKIKLLSVL